MSPVSLKFNNFFCLKSTIFCNYYCSVQKKTTDFKNHVEYKLIKHTIQLKKFQKLFYISHLYRHFGVLIIISHC